jgi:hypothetical protein
LVRIDILSAIEKNDVTKVGEPSYTSGAHIWKGMIVILNKKPTTINKIPIKIPKLSTEQSYFISS